MRPRNLDITWLLEANVTLSSQEGRCMSCAGCPHATSAGTIHTTPGRTVPWFPVWEDTLSPQPAGEVDCPWPASLPGDFPSMANGRHFSKGHQAQACRRSLFSGCSCPGAGAWHLGSPQPMGQDDGYLRHLRFRPGLVSDLSNNNNRLRFTILSAPQFPHLYNGVIIGLTSQES